VVLDVQNTLRWRKLNALAYSDVFAGICASAVFLLSGMM
jgi:hypothetical protein